MANEQKETEPIPGADESQVLDSDVYKNLSLGEVLQQARKRKRMKLPSIAKKLCIKEVYLDALERGHYYDFPALVYGVGFLRTYSVFLGLNPDEAVALFHKETNDIKHEKLKMPQATDPKVLPSAKTIIKSLLALFLLMVIWYLFEVIRYKPLPEIPLPKTEVSIENVDVSEVPLTADEIQTEKESIVEKTEESPKATPVVSEVKKTDRKPIAYGLKKVARVSFVATEETWIEVRDVEADQVFIKQTLQAGDRYNPDEDSEGLVLKTTNAGGLDVYVDGKKIKTLGKKNQTKANVLMDADNLLKD
jgi:cytoskeleton protein RodZ